MPIAPYEYGIRNSKENFTTEDEIVAYFASQQKNNFHITLRDLGRVQKLPPLPQSLLYLIIRDCSELNELSELPKSLLGLCIFNCKNLKTLPVLPDGLEVLRIYGPSEIGLLPCLPSSLKFLVIDRTATKYEWSVLTDRWTQTWN